MEKLTGLKKIKTAVFISGTGSNLKNIIKFSKQKKSPIIIDLIFSNNYQAKGLKFANQFNIKKKIFNFKNFKDAEKNLLTLLTKEFKPYVIGKITKGKNKVKLNGKIDWS